MKMTGNIKPTKNNPTVTKYISSKPKYFLLDIFIKKYFLITFSVINKQNSSTFFKPFLLEYQILALKCTYPTLKQQNSIEYT